MIVRKPFTLMTRCTMRITQFLRRQKKVGERPRITGKETKEEEGNLHTSTLKKTIFLVRIGSLTQVQEHYISLHDNTLCFRVGSEHMQAKCNAY